MAAVHWLTAGYTTHNLTLKWDGGKLLNLDDFNAGLFDLDSRFGLCLSLYEPHDYRCCDIYEDVNHGAFCRISSTCCTLSVDEIHFAS